MSALHRQTIIGGDAQARLAELPERSIDVVVTSPPYVGLRRYEAGPEEIGTETSVEAFVARLLGVTEQIARVLKPSGSFWLNIADSFSRSQRWGAPRKGMLLAPERLLIGLSDQGWLVRSKVIWSKPNPLPSSVRDRFSAAHEMVFHLVRSPYYFFDLDAVRIPHRSSGRGLTAPARRAKAKTGPPRRARFAGPLANGDNRGLLRARAEGRPGHPGGKNPGDVWTVPTAGFRGPHPAVFPERLIERPLLATCPVRVCVDCGTHWAQQALVPLAAACDCASRFEPGIVLDPFMGAGTTAVVAKRHGYDWLGVELKESYRTLATKRIAATPAPEEQVRPAA